MKKRPKTRQPYETPTLTRLTSEQAKLKLVSRADKGDLGAKELLDLMPSKKSNGKGAVKEQHQKRTA
jgi:hypothetical protein